MAEVVAGFFSEENSGVEEEMDAMAYCNSILIPLMVIILLELDNKWVSKANEVLHLIQLVVIFYPKFK